MCLICLFKDGYTFDYVNNVLKIKADSLKPVLNRQYEFLVVTTSEGVEYSQTIRIRIQNVTSVPTALIRFYIKILHLQCQKFT